MFKLHINSKYRPTGQILNVCTLTKNDEYVKSEIWVKLYYKVTLLIPYSILLNINREKAKMFQK